MRSAAALTMPVTARVHRCGSLAHAALRASEGVTRAVAGFEATPFRFAGNQLVWISESGPDHPRTVLTDASAACDLLVLVEHTQIATCHRAKTLGGCRLQKDNAYRCASIAILRLLDRSTPRGFASLLVGHCPPFPLSHRVDAVHAVAQACANDDAQAFVACARHLLGVGSGLTPSGDDFAGGALFALRLMHGPTTAYWEYAAEQIVAHAKTRTHAISAALLADLAHGQSYAALHRFAAAITHGDAEAAFTHATALAAIGASSGWDMLTGFMTALGGSAGPITAHGVPQMAHPRFAGR